MKILLTGHKGFIGRHLYTRLVAMGHDVIGIDIKDGNDVLTCTLPDVDVVIHLAGKPGVRDSIKQPNLYWEQNVVASKRIFEYYHDKYVIYASSSSTKQWWLNPYATTKRVVEQIAHDATLGLRFHTVYGVDSRPDMLYDKILNKTVYYCTNHKRDFTHVDDVVQAVIVLLNRRICGVVDVGTGNPVAVKDLFAVAGLNVPTHTSTPNEADETHANPKELIELGWSPTKNILHELKHDIIRKAALEERIKHW
jgi:nucleoside-diphosphate-sugar epimerase